MATLRSVASLSEKRFLRRITVGRDPSCELWLKSVGVSGQHATIHWTGARWVIRDLGSRNGTKINQKTLLSTSFPLALGDEIVFGDPRERWTWVDGSCPALAAEMADGTTVKARGGMLLLPDEQAPRAAVFVQAERWQLEMDGEVRPVEDGACIDVGGVSYALHLPAVNPTDERTQTMLPQRSILDTTISLSVSTDEEHVRVVLESDGRSFPLSARAFDYMLLVLARQRHADAAAGLPDAELGWMYADDLARQLCTDQSSLNTNVCRARRAAAFSVDDRGELRRTRPGSDPGEPFFADAHELLQRRGGQIRLGPANVTIVRGTLSTTPPRARR